MTTTYEGQLIASHVLSLTPDYVMGWKFWEAARELLQNAIDQHTTNPTSRILFRYDGEGERLTIGSTGAKLEPRCLLLGQTTKTLERDTIGQFGEGFKLAILALTRMSYGVTIYNGQEVWVPNFEWSDEYGTHVLVVRRYETVDHPRVDGEEITDGVLFDIVHVSERTFGDVTERYLPDEPLNTILDADHLRRKVFVGGLFVCEIEELQYGYNFAPNRINLDRDRGMASTFDVSYEASQIWKASGSDEKLYESLQSGALDTSHVSYLTRKQGDYAVSRYLEENPEAVPVSDDVEANRLMDSGVRVRRVPTALRNTLRTMHEFEFNRAGQPCERLESWRAVFGRSLGTESLREFMAIIEESKTWTTTYATPVTCDKVAV